MSRTAALSFLTVVSFTLAGADYYVQARAHQFELQAYGVTRYKESVVERVSEQLEASAKAERLAAEAEAEKFKTNALAKVDAKRDVEDIIPEVWDRLKASREEENRLPQVRHQRGGNGISFQKVRSLSSD